MTVLLALAAGFVVGWFLVRALHRLVDVIREHRDARLSYMELLDFDNALRRVQPLAPKPEEDHKP